MMNKVMDNKPVKDRKYFKPCNISNIAKETNEGSTSVLGICIVLGVFIGMVDGMDGGINYFMTCISSHKHYSKSEVLCSEEELINYKSRSSEKSQLLRDESRRLIGGLSKKGYSIYDYDISENESISET